MNQITIQQFEKILLYDVIAKQCCIEIEFCIDKDSEYCSCWLGKMPKGERNEHEIYWLGLVPDGSQGYDFDSAEELLNAPVFRRKSLKQVWDRVTVCSIDGCSVESRLPYYLD